MSEVKKECRVSFLLFFYFGPQMSLVTSSSSLGFPHMWHVHSCRVWTSHYLHVVIRVLAWGWHPFIFIIATISSLMYCGYQLNAYLAHILQFALSVDCERFIYPRTIFYTGKPTLLPSIPVRGFNRAVRKEYLLLFWPWLSQIQTWVNMQLC
jgi:hypothetical protein